MTNQLILNTAHKCEVLALVSAKLIYQQMATSQQATNDEMLENKIEKGMKIMEEYIADTSINNKVYGMFVIIGIL